MKTISNIWKDNAVKVLHSICQQIWKTQQWPQDWKDQFSFQSQRKAMPSNAKTTTKLHSSHPLAKQCSKFSKPGFNIMWAMNFHMLKLDLVKPEKPEIKLPTSIRPSKNQETSRKRHLLLLYWLCQNLWLCGSHQTVENSSRDGNTRPPDLPPEKSVWRS